MEIGAAFKNRRFDILLLVVLSLFFLSPFLVDAQQGMLFVACYSLAILAILKTLVRTNAFFLFLSSCYIISISLTHLARIINETQTASEVFVASRLIYVLFFLYFVYLISRELLASDKVQLDTIKGGIAVYFLLGFIWAFVYQIVYFVDQSAFRSLTPKTWDFLYFSFVTLTTMGYGDITPLSDLAKMLSATEGISGQLFLAIFISLIVSRYNAQRP